MLKIIRPAIRNIIDNISCFKIEDGEYGSLQIYYSGVDQAGFGKYVAIDIENNLIKLKINFRDIPLTAYEMELLSEAMSKHEMISEYGIIDMIDFKANPIL